MATASIYPTALFDALDMFLLEFEQHDRTIFAGVQSKGDAAEYALVWEYGNVRQTKAGPKTVIGTNPDGTMVWLSSQAPFGYIRIHEQEYLDVAEEILGKVTFDGQTARAIADELEAAAKKISKRCAEIVAMNAPRDSGDLAASIEAVEPMDVLLDSDTEEFGVLELEVGE